MGSSTRRNERQGRTNHYPPNRQSRTSDWCRDSGPSSRIRTNQPKNSSRPSRLCGSTQIQPQKFALRPPTSTHPNHFIHPQFSDLLSPTSDIGHRTPDLWPFMRFKSLPKIVTIFTNLVTIPPNPDPGIFRLSRKWTVKLALTSINN